MRASGRPSADLQNRCFAVLLEAFPQTCGHLSEGLPEVGFAAKWNPIVFEKGPKRLPGGLLEHLGLLEASWSGLGGLLERSWTALGPKKSTACYGKKKLCTYEACLVRWVVRRGCTVQDLQGCTRGCASRIV